MSERLTQIESQLAFAQRRKSLAIQTVIEMSVEMGRLESEKRRLLGETAVRHLHAVPDLPPIELDIPPSPNGAA